jgi:hypothetical protein
MASAFIRVYLRLASHFFSDSCVSPDRLPSSKLATLISSSKSGQ